MIGVSVRDILKGTADSLKYFEGVTLSKGKKGDAVYMEGLSFLSKMIYKRVTVCTFGRSNFTSSERDGETC